MLQIARGRSEPKGVVSVAGFELSLSESGCSRHRRQSKCLVPRFGTPAWRISPSPLSCQLHDQSGWLGLLAPQLTLDSCHQRGRRLTKGRSAFQQYRQRRLTLASLQLSVVGAIDAGQQSERVLSDATLKPQLSQHDAAGAGDRRVERIGA